MNLSKWLRYVKKVGCIEDSKDECDICQAKYRHDLWMTKAFLKKYGDASRPHVCQEHGAELGILW